MPKKVRSAKGEMVDFDLIKIKSQIASAPKSVDVKKREDFIDRKLRRRIKKIHTKVAQTAPVDVDVSVVDKEKPAQRKIKKKGK